MHKGLADLVLEPAEFLPLPLQMGDTTNKCHEKKYRTDNQERYRTKVPADREHADSAKDKTPSAHDAGDSAGARVN